MLFSVVQRLGPLPRCPPRLPGCVPPAAAPAEEEVREDAGLTVRSLVEEPAVADRRRDDRRHSECRSRRQGSVASAGRSHRLFRRPPACTRTARHRRVEQVCVDASRLRLEMIARSPVAYATHGSEAESRNQAPYCQAFALMESAYHPGALDQTRVIPPSTTMSSPVMKDESSEARKRTARAISSVVPRRLCRILASRDTRRVGASSAPEVFLM